LRGYAGKNKDGSDKYMQIMLTFNPVSELNWVKARFWDQAENSHIIYGEEQAKALNRDINAYGTLIIHSTYHDNQFIDEAYAKEMEDLKKYDEDEYNIYCLGMWGIPGGIFFDRHNVNARILSNTQPVKKDTSITPTRARRYPESSNTRAMRASQRARPAAVA